ncbi:(2Fe-2S)-binding protein [Oharaeibacter diazotrophicus]|uniref:BFD-like [2Fe-2S] binding protein n=1 Tax=Oharaeibacter diazotrophicus TaxID=1920512 RepID=A0A4R6R8Q7_9HYPH|nr:(2Fe-2S)-binding protein [Oharaeibacter diazotrophicus]TDP81966.1 BFD-like [2Fe-2S] binding protein [Oharaeibacter diazotrophicus]BBE73598.1 BFD-like [2Fe-2S] binding domain protein [Pleomorphomonas sp. SM30]GLS75388.1 hypothetical protein GCM10007904_07230 [Oharaeibacter diazotrophicus]
MIVCHCNVITDRDIRRAVFDLLSADPHRLLTPGLVYMTLGRRGRCCGCFPNAISVIRAAAAEYGGTLVEETVDAVDRDRSAA